MDFSLGFLGSILSIVIIDIVLSGDNALVIGMAAHRLPAQQRRVAIIAGGAGAIVLRIVFTVLAALLLSVPFLMAAGGVLLVYIAFKLLNQEADTHNIEAKDTLLAAIKTIILADVVMSLDNVLAVGGAAHGHLGLLAFGLFLSMPIILFGSSLIARLINRYPWLSLIGAGVLIITAARMIVDDPLIEDAIGKGLHYPVLIGAIVVLLAVVMIPTALRWRKARAVQRSQARGTIEVNR